LITTRLATPTGSVGRADVDADGRDGTGVADEGGIDPTTVGGGPSDASSAADAESTGGADEETGADASATTDDGARLAEPGVNSAADGVDCSCIATPDTMSTTPTIANVAATAVVRFIRR
jgi:hypothetical protein